MTLTPHQAHLQPRLREKLSGATNALLRGVGGGNDSVTMLLARSQLGTLRPSFEDCRIIRACGSKRQGAVATMIEHLTNSLVPTLLP